MVNLPTVLFAILLDQSQLIISSSIPEPGTSIKAWAVNNTLPEGESGAMIGYNESSKIITILSPEEPWGHAYFHYYVDFDNFTTKKYPEGKNKLKNQVTNDFVQIDDDLYFINTFPEGSEAYTMEKWSLTAEEYTVLNGSLGSRTYTETPCVTKSNDNKYIFYLGGADVTSSFYDSFFIYDVINDNLKGVGTKLPYPAIQMGCLVTSDDYLYVIGGEYTPKPKTPYTHKASNQIWSIYVGDIDNLMNNSTQWTISNKPLPYHPRLPFLGEVNELLYIIGGFTDRNGNYTCSDEVNYLQFKNSTNDTKSGRDFDIIPGPLLPEPLCYPAGIVADYEIYLFGGQNASEALKTTWMKTNYLAPTPSPTPSPTNSPTNSPTHSPTNSPTQSPTKPTASPTASPTNSPTHSPTKAPTNTTTTTTGTNTTIITTRTSSNTLTSTTSVTNATNTTTTTGQPTPAPTHAPTHSGNAASGSKHTTEYWVFMGLLISVSVLLLIAAAVWFFKRWRDNKRERLMFEQNA